MNSLELIENENSENGSKEVNREETPTGSEYDISEIINENFMESDYLNAQKKEGISKESMHKQIIQEKLHQMNEPMLQEIQEESTIHEKSCSTSKLISSKFHSRILTNSLINSSQSKHLYSFYKI